MEYQPARSDDEDIIGPSAANAGERLVGERRFRQPLGSAAPHDDPLRADTPQFPGLLDRTSSDATRASLGERSG